MLNLSKDKNHKVDDTTVKDNNDVAATGKKAADGGKAKNAAEKDVKTKKVGQNPAIPEDPETAISTKAINDREFVFSVNITEKKLKEALEASWHNFSNRVKQQAARHGWRGKYVKFHDFRNAKMIPYNNIARYFESEFKVPFVNAVVHNLRDESSNYVTARFLQSKGLDVEDVEHRDIEQFGWELNGDYIAAMDDESGAHSGFFMKYEMYLEISPQLKPIDFKSLDLGVYNVVISEEDAREDLKQWAKLNKRGKPCAPRPAKNGDIVEVDLTVSSKSRGTQNLNGRLIELGSPAFAPAFQEKFVGKSEGDHVSYTFDVPAGIDDKGFNDKTIDVSAVVKQVMDGVPYEFDDQLARALKHADLNDAIEKRQEMLKHRAADIEFFVVTQQVEDGLVAQQKVPVSERRYNSMCAALWSQIFGLDWDCDAKGFKERFKWDKEKAQQRIRNFATRQITLDALLKKFRRDEGIKLGEDDVQAAQTRFFENWYSQRSKAFEMMGQPPQDSFSFIMSDKNLRMQINQEALRSKVLRKLIKRYKEVVKAKAVDITFADLNKKYAEAQNKVGSYLDFSADSADSGESKKRKVTDSVAEDGVANSSADTQPAKKQKKGTESKATSTKSQKASEQSDKK